MFVDSATDVVILENWCSKRYEVTFDSHTLIIPETSGQVKSLVAGLNRRCCLIFPWVILFLMVAVSVGSWVIPFVIPLSSWGTRIGFFFAVLIVALLLVVFLFPCLKRCHERRQAIAKERVVQAHRPGLQDWYQIDWARETSRYEDGNIAANSLSTLLLRRRDIPPEVQNNAWEVRINPQAIQQPPDIPQAIHQLPDIPQSIIPIYHFDPEAAHKNPDNQRFSSAELPATQQDLFVPNGQDPTQYNNYRIEFGNRDMKDNFEAQRRPLIIPKPPNNPNNVETYQIPTRIERKKDSGR